MKKQTFVDTLKALQNQIEHDVKCSKAFSVILEDDFISTYNNTFAISQLVKLLQIAMDDEGKESWVDYFVWELDFGKHYRDGCVKDAYGSQINLKTSGALWDFLENEKKTSKNYT
jgi:hypothetical protein